MSDDMDAALDVLRAELLGEMAEDRGGLTDIILETLNIVSFQQAEISNLRAAVLNQMEGKYAEALRLLHADQKNSTARLIKVLSQMKEFMLARQRR